MSWKNFVMDMMGWVEVKDYARNLKPSPQTTAVRVTEIAPNFEPHGSLRPGASKSYSGSAQSERKRFTSDSTRDRAASGESKLGSRSVSISSANPRVET